MVVVSPTGEMKIQMITAGSHCIASSTYKTYWTMPILEQRLCMVGGCGDTLDL